MFTSFAGYDACARALHPFWRSDPPALPSLPWRQWVGRWGRRLRGALFGPRPPQSPRRVPAASHAVVDGRHPLGYHPGLDGLRGVAVAAVVLYHGGVAWATGGFLGVEAFFVLSGFLITSLLVAEWQRDATIRLRRFWARRARRLLPALFCLVSVIGIYYAETGNGASLPGLKGDGLATLLYLGNWHQISAGAGYFAANGPLSPLQHTWSLAIEEQFYVVWPLLVVALLGLGRRSRPRGSRGPLVRMLTFALTGVVLSALDMTLLTAGGHELDRVYYGTDTRAGSLLLGASLALAVAIARARRITQPGVGARPNGAGRNGGGQKRRGVLRSGAVLAAIALLAMLHAAHGTSGWLYPLGLLGLDVSVAIIILELVWFPGSPLSRLLSLRPLAGLGKISYGVYLWHFPLFQWLDESATGLTGTRLLLLRVTVTLAISTVSFVAIEQPIRQRRTPSWLVRLLAPVAAGGAVASLLFASTVATAALGASVAAPPPPPAKPHAGGSACRVPLRDTRDYGLSPLSPDAAARVVPAWLVAHRLQWAGSSRLTFSQCPPARVLLIGDSLAFTLGIGFMEEEQRYGVELANASILGCAFTDKGELNSRGNWERQYPGCPTALERWARDARSLHAQAIVVEMGYRDQFDWRFGRRVVHLGQPEFDRYIARRIQRFVQVLGQGNVPIVFLSVPWSEPAPLPNGSPAPAASPVRHARINAMLEAAARRAPAQVHVLNIDKVVAPGNRYQRTLDGKLCRFDGVHFTVYCSTKLRSMVLLGVRRLLAS